MTEVGEVFVKSTESLMNGTQNKYEDQVLKLQAFSAQEASQPNLSMKFIMMINDALVE